jgi:hypothetical protein
MIVIDRILIMLVFPIMIIIMVIIIAALSIMMVNRRFLTPVALRSDDVDEAVNESDEISGVGGGVGCDGASPKKSRKLGSTNVRAYIKAFLP